MKFVKGSAGAHRTVEHVSKIFRVHVEEAAWALL